MKFKLSQNAKDNIIDGIIIIITIIFITAIAWGFLVALAKIMELFGWVW